MSRSGIRGTQPLLSTALGDLDTHCVLADGRRSDELAEHCVDFSFDGRDLRVLDLDTLIEVKAAANRPKDRIALPTLLALRDRLRAR